MDSERMFNADLHPRVPAGKHGGGEFGKAGGGSKPTPTPHKIVKAAPHKTAAKNPASPLGPLTKTMAYDAKTNRGPGYGVKGGDSHVHQFQQALNRLGLTDLRGKKLANDGMLGPRTTEAIKAAQRRLGMKADGQMTPGLYRRLLAAKNLPHPARSTSPPTSNARRAAMAQPTAGPQTDDDWEQALMEFLGDLSDEDVADLSATADKCYEDGGDN